MYLFRTDGKSCSRELVTGGQQGGLLACRGARAAATPPHAVPPQQPQCNGGATSPPHPPSSVAGNGKFRFSHPSTQQHLLVWREKPHVCMVIKKLGA
jgi:hypothetical protein